jgi:CTP:molybdopterin cytidylyltransferase MocA
MPAVAVVPAAGKGKRFRTSAALEGQDSVSAKLLAIVDGEPLIDRTIRCLLEGGAASVVVVLPLVPRAVYAPSRLLADTRVRIVTNPDPSRGMFSSVQTGVGAADGDPILILPGDMPFVDASTVAAVLDTCRRTGRIVSPRRDGRRGHPIALPGRYRSVILQAPAEATLSAVLAAHERVELDVADPGILRDVDVPGDLSRPGS